MVALLVVFTILACLLADAILLSVREHRAVRASQVSTVPAHGLVFAQDGGEPVEKDEKVIGEVPWKDMDAKNESRER
ncbi:MAG: hypothetical protein GXO70_06500 [Acidobacteria bacterium]|nr:hypothetical protein [Acidobacteriota bacterium]